MDAGEVVCPHIPVSPDSEVAVMRGRSFWDCLMLGLAASLTLWPDLSTIEIAILIVIVASTTLGSAE